MHRSWIVAGVTGVVVVLVAAGCTHAGPDDRASDAPSGSSPAVPSATTTRQTSEPTTTPTGPAAPTGLPSVAASAQGAYTVVVAGAGQVTGQVTAVRCSADGGVTGTALTVAAGRTTMTLIDVDPLGTLTFAGSADSRTGAGTFRGTSATGAITFTWRC